MKKFKGIGNNNYYTKEIVADFAAKHKKRKKRSIVKVNWRGGI